MANRYGQRPYQLLFPSETNPHTQLAIDLFVFKIGYKRDQEEEIEKLKAQTGVNVMKKMVT